MQQELRHAVVYSLDTKKGQLATLSAGLQAQGIDVRPIQHSVELPSENAPGVSIMTMLPSVLPERPFLSALDLHYPVLWIAQDYTPELAVNFALRGQVLLPINTAIHVLTRSLSLIISRRNGAEYLATNFHLSPQETRLLRCMMRGLSTEESAEALGCKPLTIPSYWNRIFRKSGVRTQRELLLLYIQALCPQEGAMSLGAHA